MEDQYNPSDEDIHNIFNGFDEMLDKIGEIIESTKVPMNEFITKEVKELINKKFQEYRNRIIKSSNEKIIVSLLYSNFNLWINVIFNNYTLQAMEKGKIGSKKYTEAFKELMNNRLEKDLYMPISFIDSNNGKSKTPSP